MEKWKTDEASYKKALLLGKTQNYMIKHHGRASKLVTCVNTGKASRREALLPK